MIKRIKLRIRGGKVIGSVLGPKLGPLGLDSKAVAAKLNVETAYAGGRKVYVYLLVDGRDWTVQCAPATDSYNLRKLYLDGYTEESLTRYAMETLGKTEAKSFEARLAELRGTLRSLNVAS